MGHSSYISSSTFGGCVVAAGYISSIADVIAEREFAAPEKFHELHEANFICGETMLYDVEDGRLALYLIGPRFNMFVTHPDAAGIADANGRGYPLSADEASFLKNVPVVDKFVMSELDLRTVQDGKVKLRICRMDLDEGKSNTHQQRLINLVYWDSKHTLKNHLCHYGHEMTSIELFAPESIRQATLVPAVLDRLSPTRDSSVSFARTDLGDLCCSLIGASDL